MKELLSMIEENGVGETADTLQTSIRKVLIRLKKAEKEAGIKRPAYRPLAKIILLKGDEGAAKQFKVTPQMIRVWKIIYDL